MERLTLTYTSAERMIEDLRSWGRNLHRERARRTWSRQERHRWLNRIEAGMPRQTDGQLYLTFELIYGHAIKPAPRAKLAESTTVSLSDMRTLLRQSR
jgi:malonyl-CoA O-methyltransferase